jgi:predicted ArsR family transcriptional regulator
VSLQCPNTDADFLDLLRIAGPLSVIEMADAMEVTPTAIRQRLVRIMAEGLVERSAVRAGRGRPRHYYRLTDKGLRQTGSNFADLAIALWEQFRAISDPQMQREVLRSVAKALAASYSSHIQGRTTAERLRSLKELLAQRRIPVTIEQDGGRLVLKAHACPYPKLAESDPRVCDMEQMMFSELVGQDVCLKHCRRNGGLECRFEVR